MEQDDFIDMLVDGTKPSCRLEKIVAANNHHICQYHLGCAYKETKEGIPYCSYVEQLRALCDEIGTIQDM